MIPIAFDHSQNEIVRDPVCRPERITTLFLAVSGRALRLEMQAASYTVQVLIRTSSLMLQLDPKLLTLWLMFKPKTKASPFLLANSPPTGSSNQLCGQEVHRNLDYIHTRTQRKRQISESGLIYPTERPHITTASIAVQIT